MPCLASLCVVGRVIEEGLRLTLTCMDKRCIGTSFEHHAMNVLGNLLCRRPASPPKIALYTPFYAHTHQDFATLVKALRL